MPGDWQPGSGSNDRVLVARARSGDLSAFDAIVERYRTRLLGQAVRWLSDRESAADCVQETLVRALESLPRFRGKGSLRSYLYGVLKNVCLEEQRRKARDPQAGLLTEAVSAIDVHHAVCLREKFVSAICALASLPVGTRAAALLNLVEGLGPGEVAAILEISTDAAKMRLSRARKLLSALPASQDQVSSARRSLAEGYQFLGSLLLRRGRQSESDRALLRALAFDPDTAYDIWTHQILARGTRLEVPARQQAVRVLRHAMDKWAQVPMVPLTLGNVEYWEQGDYAAAERLFRAASRGDGTAGWCARLHLAHLYCHTGRPREAPPLLGPLIVRRRHERYAAVLMARSLALCGDLAARRWAQQARDLAMGAVGRPRSQRASWIHAGNVRMLAGEVFSLLGEPDLARRCLRAAQAAYPADYSEPRLQKALRALSR